MSATFRYSPDRIVVVVVGSTEEVWTNETGERVFVDRIELVLPDDDGVPLVVADVRGYLNPGETCRLHLKVPS